MPTYLNSKHFYVYILAVMVTTTRRGIGLSIAGSYLWEYENANACLISFNKEEEVYSMKKHTLGLAVMIALAMGVIGGQTTAHASSTHTVETGDTLWEVARDNAVSVEDLLTWNNLDSSLIFPGQALKIESNIETYTVKKGDTLSHIAEKHNISLTELMSWNEISGHLIYPGDLLALEDMEISSPKSDVKSSQAKVQTPAASPPTKKAQEQTNPPVAKAPAPSAPAGKEMSVTATAYTAYCAGCSGITYTGIDLRSNPNQKVIAVDPNIIPLGSRVWVEGYGEAIAGDIGGAIKGNIIDVFLEDKQDALNWGRKTVTIRILD